MPSRLNKEEAQIISGLERLLLDQGFVQLNEEEIADEGPIVTYHLRMKSSTQEFRSYIQCLPERDNKWVFYLEFVLDINRPKYGQIDSTLKSLVSETVKPAGGRITPLAIQEVDEKEAYGADATNVVTDTPEKFVAFFKNIVGGMDQARLADYEGGTGRDSRVRYFYHLFIPNMEINPHESILQFINQVYSAAQPLRIKPKSNLGSH
ncbi:MAG: hypothetical protein ABIJ08_00220 [Nanoarchaeota archaeon]